MGEQPLAGGVDNVGAVLRIGDTVRKPSASPAVRAFLTHLADAGFAGAPRWLGVDDRGRDVLDFIPGDVAIPPYPAWAAREELLVSVARLQRSLHVASAGFRLPAGLTWPEHRNPAGELVCHTDLCLENVVVREGRAVAFVDFDMAHPVDPLFDIAIAARHWVPLRDPADGHWPGVDHVRRFAVFAEAHELPGAERDRLVGMLLRFLDQALANMRAKAESGHPGFAALWADGYEDMNRRSHKWLQEHRSELAG
ncbi:aminoglycoside phosphotransferase family protein [Labedaea rhizosphaerae]|uniref:Phosphotransferase family enzyme n=1 Tax=Labedaea rhizosphaerae TaxID=598644 RepID=A0A4R6RVY5_LABRH|nr:phosphotransferase [Labedaea rhizosphaerae]TDP91172.1 phosphotransferase family enzyme [Labedaea rhizosphaerae]